MDIKDYVDHWEITKTYLTYNNSSFLIDTVNNEFKVIDGHNQILIVTIERNPIFKEGKELTDLYSTESLLIELDSSDNLVTVQKPSNSKLFRKLVAFSPDYGINPLHSEEQLTLTRKDGSIWTINSQIDDFIFKAEFNFLTNQTLTDKIEDY
ncbi:hypothetical protein [Algoriphagus sp. oki45]|uniref:hypothetical protein n=1 Tax=Algoriphagus sp. oki45 TaxID=3067294 RepID=UPI0030C67777